MNSGPMIVMFALVLALATVGLGASQGHPHDQSGTVQLFQADLQYAEELARTTGDGATLVVTTASDGQSTYEVFANRPISGLTPMEATPRRDPFTAWTGMTVAGGGAVGSPIALMIDSGGGVSYAQWSPGGADLTETGTCSGGTLTVTFTDGDSSETHTIACGSGAFE